MHFETITKLLNLPNVNVIEVLDCNDAALHLMVEPADDSQSAVCSHCGMVGPYVRSQQGMDAGRGFASKRQTCFPLPGKT